eukprot:Protomagalhaensia_wolfi_Nauph_80__3940@NODE_39_length_4444_cov_91_567083_g31_i0_p2_GENE_NODE_39_length_4444_cov_91_567083_g31_i0NODE_39_length_4444_cov_91_567083_g31_i0_p2_ORF_typecomplete_len368_score36_88PAP2/PF01569_21/5_1e30Rhomboid/PF01694_22/0_015PAP2_3/PF14378_6/0_095Wzt_C/PF14524_6/0_086CPP1like/PF11833_8/0_23_NODE_39_length_4444_cov_91_567083_g31_i026933796
MHLREMLLLESGGVAATGALKTKNASSSSLLRRGVESNGSSLGLRPPNVSEDIIDDSTERPLLGSKGSPSVISSRTDLLVEVLLRLALIGGVFALNVYGSPFERPIYDWSKHAAPFKVVERVDYDWLLGVGIGFHLLVMLLLQFGPRSTSHGAETGLQKYQHLILYLLGASLSMAATMLMTDLIKFTYCRPRPDYLSRCIGVQDTYGWLAQHNYRSFGELPPHVPCLARGGESHGPGPDILHEGRLSFPSGHSSTSASIWGFAAFWLWSQRSSTVLTFWPQGTKAIAFASLLLAPVYVAISRTVDNWHHPTDVLAGLTLGFGWAYACTRMYTPTLPTQQGLTTVVQSLQGTKCLSAWATPSTGLMEV